MLLNFQLHINIVLGYILGFINLVLVVCFGGLYLSKSSLLVSCHSVEKFSFFIFMVTCIYHLKKLFFSTVPFGLLNSTYMFPYVYTSFTLDSPIIYLATCLIKLIIWTHTLLHSPYSYFNFLFSWVLLWMLILFRFSDCTTLFLGRFSLFYLMFHSLQRYL